MSEVKFVITINDVLKGFGNDKDLFKGFYKLYKKNYTPRMKEIEESFETGNMEVIHRLAHTIKGSILNFKIDNLSEIAEEFEQLTKKQNIEEIKKHFSAYKKTCDQFIELMDEEIKKI